MPPELMELYNLYQMEIETRENNEKDQNLLVEAEKILRVSCPPNFRARNKGIEMIINRLGLARPVHEQEEISRNHVQAFIMKICFGN